MIRYTLLTLFVTFFSMYALKDWYRGLLGMLFLVAFMERQDMPEQMFGIYGMAPFNFLLVFVFLGMLMQRSKEDDGWRMPTGILVPILAMGALIVIGHFRFTSDMSAYREYFYILGGEPSSKFVLFLEHVVTTIKWMIPAMLVLMGCNPRERANETIFVLTIVLVILGVQIIRSMGLGVITDGDALQRRAARIMDRDIGFHRNQISLWMAAGFWFVWLLFMESKAKLRKFALLCSAGTLFLALVLTGSRGGLLTWAITGAVFAFVRWRRLLIVGPVVVLIAVASVPALQERVMQTFNPETNAVEIDAGSGSSLATASAGRTVLWSYSLEVIAKRPLIGYGREAILNTGVSLRLFEDFDRSMAAKHPHNAYIQLVFDNGLIGLAIVLFFFLKLINRSIHMVRLDDENLRLVGGIGIAWLVSFLAAGLTAQKFYPNEGSIFVWCVAAIVIRQGFESRVAQKPQLVRRPAVNRRLSASRLR